MADKIVCPEGHTRVWAKGLAPSRTGPKQRYVCFTCGRTFYKSKSDKPKSEPKPTKPKAVKSKVKSSKKKAG